LRKHRNYPCQNATAAVVAAICHNVIGAPITIGAIRMTATSGFELPTQCRSNAPVVIAAARGVSSTRGYIRVWDRLGQVALGVLDSLAITRQPATQHAEQFRLSADAGFGVDSAYMCTRCIDADMQRISSFIDRFAMK